MKLFDFFPGLTAFAALTAACCCHGFHAQGWAADQTPPGNLVERNYLVKGMTCGGCVFGVKRALERAGIAKDQIVEVDYRKPDPKNHVGHARVRISKDQYKGVETDCKVVKAIRDNPGYVAYWDVAAQDPCGLDPARKN